MRRRGTGTIVTLQTVLLVLLFSGAQAAVLDDVYGPLLKKSDFLYSGEVSFYGLEEEGILGSAAYEEFDSSPHYFSLNNSFTLSPADYIDIAFGVGTTFPDKYRRFTYGTSGNLSALQHYDIDYFYDFTGGLRLRNNPFEFYADIVHRRQKTAWDSASHPATPNYFSFIRAHFEDIRAGVRFLETDEKQQAESNLSRYMRPLLHKNQLNAEFELGYTSGKVKRNSDYFSGGHYLLYFFHALTPHFIPTIKARYGMNEKCELNSGIAFNTDYSYKFEYKEFRPGSLSFLIDGVYRLESDVSVPLGITVRPAEHIQLGISSDFRFAGQKLEYKRKSTADVVTEFPEKKLKYYNTKPTIELTYLRDGDKEIIRDEFPLLTKKFLRKAQFMLRLLYQKDITHLSKGPANGPQNIINPSNAFLYPLDNFVAGTEYAALLTGNTSRFVTNVQPQNYYLLACNFIYGLTDTINTTIGVGYHSSSSLHHFTLYDLNSRFFRFKPYYFFDAGLDWRVGKNCLLSLDAHFVPKYNTVLTTEGNTQDDSSEDAYIDVALQCKILF